MIETLEPEAAWALFQQDEKAVLLDVRAKIEREFVGYPLGSMHVAWKEAPYWQINPGFIESVMQIAPDPLSPILVLCRSGHRSMDAARALEDAGYQRLVNIQHGFEGPLDSNSHRGTLAGWRFSNLPWQQS